MQPAVTSEARIVLFEPRNPETMPEEKRARPYPPEMKVKMLAARACVTPNSVSISGKIGEKRVRPLKFMNQINQMKRRKSKPLPRREGKRRTTLTLLCRHRKCNRY